MPRLLSALSCFPHRFCVLRSVSRVLACGTIGLLAASAQAQPTLSVPQNPASAPDVTVATARQTAPALRLELLSEQPSGIFYESETLRTRTALLFSLRAWNELNAERELTLTWTIEDAQGRTMWRKQDKFPMSAGGYLLRREAWDTPKLGAYVLRVDAFAKGDEKKGAKRETTTVRWPFAVVAAPRPSFRPRSFFALSTPANLTAGELNFYERVGARVLRSPWNWSNNDYTQLDAAMQERLSRKIATWGVVPVDEAGQWSRNLSSLMTRYTGITRWEAFEPSAVWPSTSTQRLELPADVSVRSEISLLGPLEGGITAGTASSRWNGSVVPLPLADEADKIRGEEGDSANVLRALLWAKRRAPGGNFLVAQNEVPGILATRTDREEAERTAALMVRRYILAVMTGASGMSTPGFAPSPSPATLSESVRAAREREMRTSVTRAAAFSAMTKLLENASREDELFPASPLIWGATFRTLLPSGDEGSPVASSQVAVLWTDRSEGNARLLVRLPGARVLDLYGNETARTDKKGVLTVPLGVTPVYVVSEATPAAAATAWKAATLQNFVPLAVQFLPIGQTPQTTPKSKEAAAQPVATPPTLRVRVQNVGIAPLSGSLRLVPPRGWELIRERQDWTLEAGESRILTYAVARASHDKDGEYVMNAEGTGRGEKWNFRAPVSVATASETRQPINLDGDLGEWQDATWMNMKSQGAGKNNVTARLALRFDEQNLYVAARVNENTLQTRRPEGVIYPFWESYDALQLVFGLRDEPIVKPARDPFRDTDYGFLLTPFAEGITGTQGRVLRLWNTSTPYDAPRDALRWGGSINGSQCVVRRDEAGATFYEAVIPLSEMPTLRPSNRGARDIPVRFSWMAHTDEGPVLEWSEATNVFPWWRNPGSFWPPTFSPLAAQTTLGFSPSAPISTPAALPQVQQTPAAQQPVRPLTVAPQPAAVTPTQPITAQPVPALPAAPPVNTTEDTPYEANDNSPLKPLPPLPPSSLPPAETGR